MDVFWDVPLLPVTVSTRFEDFIFRQGIPINLQSPLLKGGGASKGSKDIYLHTCTYAMSPVKLHLIFDVEFNVKFFAESR